ncbi:PilW family protein [Anaerobacillus sp. MEB173]|uniref:PilW family protein n=1 Tax=Anaerobacillus sp. MEB173 TaxID=3383345 RepID=UPI003F8E0847
MVIKKWNNEKGMTLIEVLAVLAISSLVITLVYGVLISGVSLFHKGSTETLMRQDADIVMAHIVNDFYEKEGYTQKEFLKENEVEIDEKKIKDEILDIIRDFSNPNFTYELPVDDLVFAEKEIQITLVISYNDENRNVKPLELESRLIYPWK